MKKYLVVILSVVVFFSTSTCGVGKSASIEPTTWAMSSIQSAEDGSVLYCSANEKENHVEAEVRDIVCQISGSTIEILNQETSEKWSGTYHLLETSDHSSIYEGNIDGKECHIVKSVMVYWDGTDRDALIISFEGYVLNFFA